MSLHLQFKDIPMVSSTTPKSVSYQIWVKVLVLVPTVMYIMTYEAETLIRVLVYIWEFSDVLTLSSLAPLPLSFLGQGKQLCLIYLGGKARVNIWTTNDQFIFLSAGEDGTENIGSPDVGCGSNLLSKSQVSAGGL